MKLKKITAILCALSMLYVFAGCSKSEEISSESIAETSAVTDATETTEAEESEESQQADAPAVESVLDTEKTFGSMHYLVDGEWPASESDEIAMYTMTDNISSVVLQLIDGSAYDIEDETETVEHLAEQSEETWNSLENFTILEKKWDEEILPGKKCFIISYSYEINSITATYTSVFFANFTDTAKDVFSVSSASPTEDGLSEEYLEKILATATFDE